MATTLIKGGTVVSATGRGLADVLIDGETVAALLDPASTAFGHDLAAPSTPSSTRLASSSSRVGSMSTPICRCRSAAPTRPTRSRPAPGRRPGGVRRPSSTSPSSAMASGSRTAWPRGTTRPRASAPSTTASTRSSVASTTTPWPRCAVSIEEGMTQLQDVHGLPGRLLQQRRADPQGHAGRGEIWA